MQCTEAILKDILNISPFPRWNLDALYPFVSDKLSRLEFDLLFPSGTESLISAYQHHLQMLLSESITVMPDNMGIAAKIRWLMHTHFEHIIKHAEAEHSAVIELYRPSLLLQIPVYVGQLTDIIWISAGDTSIDMNYYTKRGTLGVIYTATLLYWHTSNATIDEVMHFFDARLNNLKSATKNVKKYTPTPDNILKNIKLLKSIFWDK
jgi:ubiquinone biosynthesis protein COQ9